MLHEGYCLLGTVLGTLDKLIDFKPQFTNLAY